jgi:hypothetical protein
MDREDYEGRIKKRESLAFGRFEAIAGVSISEIISFGIESPASPRFCAATLRHASHFVGQAD